MAKSASHFVSRAFQMRQFSSDARANGPTDFKGETTVFNTDDRLAFLKTYAAYAARFFEDPELDTLVVTEAEIGELVDDLKPQPLPSVRRRLKLERWKSLGFRAGQVEEDRAKLGYWENQSSVEAGEGRLRFVGDGKLRCSFPPQRWRLRVTWRQWGPIGEIAFLGNDCAVAYQVKQDGSSSEWAEIVAEIDLCEHRWNLYVNDVLHVDWNVLPETLDRIDGLCIKGGVGAELAALWGVGYEPMNNGHKPYTIRTFLDERFSVRPSPTEWTSSAYDDGLWDDATAPVVHGGERHAGEDLYLRTSVTVDTFDRAMLEIETLDPGGEVWVNGDIVAVSRDRHPLKLDISDHLKPGAENLVAIRVYAFDASLGETQGQTPTDANIGWFAGRMHIDLTPSVWIDDLFVYTTAVTQGSVGTPPVLQEQFNASTLKAIAPPRAEAVEVRVEANVCNRDSEDRWRGRLRLEWFLWHPQEAAEPVAEAEFEVDCCEWCDQLIVGKMVILQPQLWSYRSPSLYKVQATLLDENGTKFDDYVITTGLRTISQEGGIFRINNQPEMLNGALQFGFRAPLEKIATWHRCPPTEWLVREIAQVRKMNGNAIRVHVHAWAHLPPARSVNDPRMAEIADQLGLMFLWATTSWVRSGTPWGVDLEGLPKYIRQVRNHPSIVLWEISNHPTVGQKYDRGPEGWDEFYRRVHEIIYPLDPSRLIAPTSICGEGSSDTPALDLPGMARGSHDSPTGGGADWTTLRNFIEVKRSYFTERKDRAYFNFEHQESIGQPNHELVRGKPWYRVMSYEWHIDEGSIGRRLTADEWRESQAWQAFSAYEAMRVMRLMGYDGFAWCCLHGGPNTVTYKKPLIDFLGHAKLSWHIHRMVFQSVLVGTDDLDVVYGPDDWVHPIVLNLGAERIVDVELAIRSPNGEIVQNQIHRRIKILGGRSTTSLPAIQPKVPGDGIYAMEFTVRQSR